METKRGFLMTNPHEIQVGLETIRVALAIDAVIVATRPKANRGEVADEAAVARAVPYGHRAIRERKPAWSPTCKEEKGERGPQAKQSVELLL
jgi:hypothetical protein